MGMSPGERLLTRRIRAAAPPEIATHSEYVPADVASQEMDGAFGHVPLYGWRKGYDRIAPHYINLQRFAFPDFKTFHLIYYVPPKNGNWFLLKYPFFNGDGYYLTGSCPRADEHAERFWKKVYRIQHALRDAFTATDVEPLVETEVPQLFANRFSTADGWCMIQVGQTGFSRDRIPPVASGFSRRFAGRRRRPCPPDAAHRPGFGRVRARVDR